MFSGMVDPSSPPIPSLTPESVPALLAVVALVDAVPPELVTLRPDQYVELLAALAYMRAASEAFTSRRVIMFAIPGYDRNPVAIVRAAMAACPDEAPTPGTTELSFITEPDLRDSIRLDISAANSDLAQGEWKGATVLAGSAVEALLLWALQDHQKKMPDDITAAIAAMLKSNPGTDLDGQGWHLHQYVTVAAHLKIITPDTAKAVELAKDARNLVHPGRSSRLGQKCDRGTALSALAAVEAVARDLRS